jgi:hypothetical protein
MKTSEADRDPFSANKCRTDLPVRAEWPTQRTLRIITFNLNGRPPGLGSALSGTETKSESGEPIGGWGSCESAHHLATSATARGRGFLRWLDTLPPDLYPHCLCLQELMWDKLANTISDELERRGWKTMNAVDPRQDQGCAGGTPTCFVPQAGSGLALFVHEPAGFNMIESGGFAFQNRLGVDRLARKGFRWASVLIRSPSLLGLPPGPLFKASDPRCGLMLLATIHPQAYMALARPGPLAQSSEGNLGYHLRRVANSEIDSLGGYPLSVAKIHELQFQEVADHLQNVALPAAISKNNKNRFVGAFIGGDFNVNRWATRPGSEEERDVNTAALGCSTELRNVLTTLDAVAPQLVTEPEDSPFYPGNRGRFSWDGILNSCARPLTPLEKPALGWIDYVMFLRPSRAKGIWSSWLGRNALPLRADNRALVARLDPPCPELAPLFGSPVCAHVRSLLLKLPLLPILSDNEEERKEEASWRREYAVLNRLRNSRLKQEGRSNQLWQGLASYAMRDEDPDADSAKDLRIGQPHPFRSFSDVSDHHPVLGRFILSHL